MAAAAGNTVWAVMCDQPTENIFIPANTTVILEAFSGDVVQIMNGIITMLGTTSRLSLRNVGCNQVDLGPGVNLLEAQGNFQIDGVVGGIGGSQIILNSAKWALQNPTAVTGNPIVGDINCPNISVYVTGTQVGDITCANLNLSGCQLDNTTLTAGTISTFGCVARDMSFTTTGDQTHQSLTCYASVSTFNCGGDMTTDAYTDFQITNTQSSLNVTGDYTVSASGGYTRETLFFVLDNPAVANDEFSGWNLASSIAGNSIPLPRAGFIRNIRAQTFDGTNVNAQVNLVALLTGTPLTGILGMSILNGQPNGQNTLATGVTAVDAFQWVGIRLTSATGGGKPLLASIEYFSLSDHGTPLYGDGP